MSRLMFTGPAHRVAVVEVVDEDGELGVTREQMCDIGIPALDGNTWPLRWYSEPTPTAPYVDPSALLGVTQS